MSTAPVVPPPASADELGRLVVSEATSTQAGGFVVSVDVELPRSRAYVVRARCTSLPGTAGSLTVAVLAGGTELAGSRLRCDGEAVVNVYDLPEQRGRRVQFAVADVQDVASGFALLEQQQ